MTDPIKIPTMPEPEFNFVGWKDSDGSEIITTTCAELDTLCRWGQECARIAQEAQGRAEAAENLVARLRQEAQIQAMEARAHISIVQECYQIATGAAGEPGTWNGAAPVREAFDALRARLAAVPALVEALEWVKAHHEEINRKAYRPIENSATLKTVCAALSAWKGE